MGQNNLEIVADQVPHKWDGSLAVISHWKSSVQPNNWVESYQSGVDLFSGFVTASQAQFSSL